MVSPPSLIFFALLFHFLNPLKIHASKALHDNIESAGLPSLFSKPAKHR